MKKVILALAIVSVTFAACNNGETKDETPKIDSPAVETPVPDPAPAPDSTVVPVPDSTQK